jgi:hypothetical protein
VVRKKNITIRMKRNIGKEINMMMRIKVNMVRMKYMVFMIKGKKVTRRKETGDVMK